MTSHYRSRPQAGDWKATRARILRRDRYRCQIAGPRCAGKATEVDHVIPRMRGGTDDAANLRAVCRPCHDEKTAAEKRAANRARMTKRVETRHPSDDLGGTGYDSDRPLPWERTLHRLQREQRRIAREEDD